MSTVTTLTAALAQIALFNVENRTRLCAEIGVATAALTGFEIHARVSASGAFQKLYSTAQDYLAPAGLLLGTGRSDSATNTDLTTIAAAAKGFFQMDVAGFHEIKLMASGDTAVTTVTRGVQ